MQRRLLFLLLFGLNSFLAKAQFTKYASQNDAFCHLIVADTVWVATENGVFKMLTDGTTLAQFPQNEQSIDFFPPRSLCLDGQGRLLVNRGFSGIERLENGAWTRLTTENTPMLANQDFSEMATDAQGNIWLAGQNLPTFRFDGADWDTVSTPFENLSIPGAFKMRRGPDGALWFAYQNGIARFDGSNWTTSEPNLPNETTFFDLNWDFSGNLFALQTTNLSGANVWKFPNGDLTSPILEANTGQFGAASYGSLAVDNLGQIWLGTNVELADFPLIKWDGTTWATFKNTNSAVILERPVPQISATSDGAIWVNNNGRYDSNQPFYRYKNAKWDVFSCGFSGWNICGEVDKSGKVWFGGPHFIGNFDPKTAQFQHHFPSQSRVPIFVFHDIAFAPDSTIWVGGESGLYHFDGQNWTYYNKQNTGGGVPNEFVGHLTVDTLGVVWFSSAVIDTFGVTFAESALTSFDPKTNVWQNYAHPAPNSEWDIRDLQVAPDSTVWIAAYDGIFRLKNGIVESVTDTIFNTNFIGWELDLGTNGNVWTFLHGLGLARFDGSEWTLFTIENSGLYSETNITSMAVDANNSVWIGFFDPNSSASSPFLQKFNGQTWTNFYQPINYTNLIFSGSDGNIWFHDVGPDFYSYFPLSRWIRGKIRADENVNCLSETIETPLNQWIVAAKAPDGQSFFGKTNANGFYEINLDSTVFEVKALPPSRIWGDCDEVLTLDLTSNSADSADFSGEILADCPLMTLDLSTPFLRRCFSNNYFQIKYCNLGTATATDVKVQFILPDLLELQGMSQPFSTVGAGIYEIEIGTVGVGECGQFSVTVKVSCDAELGSTLCASAAISPDTFCIPAPNWGGANLSAEAKCQGDSVVFTIKNDGIGPMTNPLPYVVIEDEVLMMTAPVQLPLGAVAAISFPISSGFQRIQIPQETGHPFPGLVNAAVESCNGQAGGGYFLQFPFDNASPFSERECAEVIGSFDPNDKAATPQGVDNQHFILPRTPIDYKIRFQNTGTDTAFTVVVRDTLAAWLDVSTLRIGSGAHPFSWDLTGAGELVFLFENILLPDSNTNEIASHGFVSFQIEPSAATPLGTLVENRAGIFFDFNEVVLTNTVFRTVDTGFLKSNIPNGLVENNPESLVEIFPNPAAEKVFISLKNGLTGENCQLFNPFGQLVFEKKMKNNAVEIPRNGLPSGVYFLKIFQKEKEIAVGKILWK